MQPHRREVPVGIVFSTSGAYATVGRDMRDGALLAIEAVNAGPCGDVRLSPQIVDPGGVLDAYRFACDDLLGGQVSATWSAATPRRAARRSFPSSRNSTRCYGIRPTTRGSRAATT